MIPVSNAFHAVAARRVDGVWATNTRLLHRAPATKLKFKKRAGPGDGEAGTFKIDIMAAVFGSCKCGKLKADHIGPELKCPPC